MPPKINWAKINAKLPIELTPEQRKLRFAMFEGFDPNGNGYLSLAELDKGIRDILGLEELFDCKPAIMRAYQSAKNCGKKNKSRLSDDYVEKNEFRKFLWYLRQYFELYAMFDEVDTGDDRRVNLDEFKAALGRIATWGLKIDDPEAEFKKIDKNGGGQILFDEFAEWALSHNLDLEDD